MAYSERECKFTSANKTICESTCRLLSPISNHHCHLLLLYTKDDTHFTLIEGRKRRPSGSQYCSEGVQPLPKAICHSGGQNKHYLQCDSNLGLLTLQPEMLPLDHCIIMQVGEDNETFITIVKVKFPTSFLDPTEHFLEHKLG